MNMQRLLIQQTQLKEHETIQRIATNGHANQLSYEVASLRDENQQLRELLKGNQGLGKPAAPSNYRNHAAETCGNGWAAMANTQLGPAMPKPAHRAMIDNSRDGRFEDELEFFQTPVHQHAFAAS